MRYFLVDDDDYIRAMLSNIIEDADLGTVEGEAIDGSEVYIDVLEKKQIDILIIDLLMPNLDGIETIRKIGPYFTGKIVMLSQVETKDLIGEAYSLGIDYYITKPINCLEIISILTKVQEHILMERSIHSIQQSLSSINRFSVKPKEDELHSIKKEERFYPASKHVLTDLGIICEVGHKDLLDILEILHQRQIKTSAEFPLLKELFEEVARKKSKDIHQIQKEIKSSEQRVRRAIHQALIHIAALGLNDYSNPIFELYASRFFDFTQVRLKMLELQGKSDEKSSPTRVNIKKFIYELYTEVTRED